MISFHKLTIGDKTLVDDFTSKFPPYSDFNFTSLFSYNIENDCEIHIDKHYMIIKMRDYLSNDYLYSYLTKYNSLKIPLELLSITTKLQMVPEHSLVTALMDSGKFAAQEERDNFDYIYLLEKNIALEGGAYEHKRWRVNQFRNYYPDCKIKISNIIKLSEKKQMLNLFDNWADSKKRKTDHEKVALSRLLDYSEKLNIINATLWDKKTLIGFSVFEKLSHGYAIGHFMKANDQYKGIYDMLHYESMKHMVSIGCKYLNSEQDLGFESMRKAKMSWNPVKFLKKYTISY